MVSAPVHSTACEHETVVASGEPVTDRSRALRVRLVLQAFGCAPFQHVACDVSAGTATLRGHVSSFFLKQMAQNAAVRVPGIRRVDNLLEVHP